MYAVHNNNNYRRILAGGVRCSIELTVFQNDRRQCIVTAGIAMDQYDVLLVGVPAAVAQPVRLFDVDLRNSARETDNILRTVVRWQACNYLLAEFYDIDWPGCVWQSQLLHLHSIGMSVCETLIYIIQCIDCTMLIITLPTASLYY